MQPATQLDSVKEEEEELEQQDEQWIFKKHRVNKFKEYVNFNNKEDSFHDVSEFSWEFHAVDLF